MSENSYDDLITNLSAKYQVPFALIKATIAIESAFDPAAFNASDPQGGALGLGQFLIGTARWLWKGITVTPQMMFLPGFAIESIAKLHQYNLKRYGGRIRDAIAAYNAGSVRKKSNGDYINQSYVNKVYSKYMYYLSRSPGSSDPGFIPPPAKDDGGSSNLGSVLVFGSIGIVAAALIVKMFRS